MTVNVSTYSTPIRYESRLHNENQIDKTQNRALKIAQQVISQPAPEPGEAEKNFPNEPAEFREFVDRLPLREKKLIESKWKTVPEIKQKALLISTIAKKEYPVGSNELLSDYQNPIFRDPDFEMIALYAMSQNLSQSERLDSMEASKFFCYHQAIKLFGAENVYLHMVDEEGGVIGAPATGNKWKPAFSKESSSLRIFQEGILTASDLGKDNLFFGIEPKKYQESRPNRPDIDDVVLQLGRTLQIWSATTPSGILPPAALQKMAEKQNPFGPSRIRPVLGLSKNRHMTDFSYRDVFIPSSFTTPKTADGHPSNHTISYYKHDCYHFAVDAVNMNLAEHQKMYNAIAKETRDIKLIPELEKVFRNFSNSYLDREFASSNIWRMLYDSPAGNKLIFEGKPFFEVLAQHKELLFFYDITGKIMTALPEDRPRVIATLAKAIRQELPELSLDKLLKTGDDPFISEILEEPTLGPLLKQLNEAIKHPLAKL